jgi:hypothetical protein
VVLGRPSCCLEVVLVSGSGLVVVCGCAARP